MKSSLLTLVCVFCTFLTVFAQEESSEEKKSMDEIAKEMSNPTLPMFNLSMFYDYQKMTGDLPGASDQSINLLGVQPPLSFPLKNGKNLIIRPLFTFNFAAPVYKSNGFESAGGLHFGDIPIDILYAGTNTETGVMFGYGAVANIPTNSSKDLRGEWRLGPSLLIGKLGAKSGGILIINNSFQLSGSGDKHHVLGGQYVFFVGLGNGWQFVASPPFSYNWKTEGLTLPIGGGPFRTIMMGKTPVKVGVQFNYYISQPDPFGPKWGLRFNITPRLTRPW
ncbi:hypothetical protein [Urechidicola vernalis]|uniref:Neuromedin U n=1 Tax=Urechidicola vernalis TaxID=3075600 RepID=A0ABU2Y629_9FLAO|nr:hypothetical protein [Urechidicola sp. P050]MDT0553079.1 hypothetical protein [Urechidicola sp. P050]